MRLPAGLVLDNRTRPFTRTLFRALLLAPAWWVLAGGDASSWWFGIPVLIIAALASTALAPDPPQRVRWRLKGFVAFVGFFQLQSVRSGINA